VGHCYIELPDTVTDFSVTGTIRLHSWNPIWAAYWWRASCIGRDDPLVFNISNMAAVRMTLIKETCWVYAYCTTTVFWGGMENTDVATKRSSFARWIIWNLRMKFLVLCVY